MVRTVYRGAVRDSETEQARDARMLRLAEQGVPPGVIAQRMGVTVNSVRSRIKRALITREAPTPPLSSPSTEIGTPDPS